MDDDLAINRRGDVLVRENMLKVLYTNHSKSMPWYLHLSRGWLQESNEQERFIGLDLEYTRNNKDVAVIQLCHKRNVLVFQWSRYVSFGALDPFIGYIYMMKIA